MNSWLQDDDAEMHSNRNANMHSIHIQEKSVEGFIRTLKNKIYKYSSSISKNMYVNKLADIVNEYKRYIS